MDEEGRTSAPRSTVITTAVVLGVFVVADWLQEILRLTPGYRGLYDTYPYWVPEGAKSLLQILLVLAATGWLLRSATAAPRQLGFLAPLRPALLFGWLATLPMWLGFALSSRLTGIPMVEALYLSFLSPLAEEAVYRGFAFGQLRRLAGWGLWPAAVLTAAIFGWGHAEGAESFGQGTAIFLITGLGSVVSCWIYERWGFNLWAPFLLHLLMNLSWEVFSVADGAYGGWLPTVLQASAVIAAVLLTLFRQRVPGLRTNRSVESAPAQTC